VRINFRGQTNFKWSKGLFLKIKDLSSGKIIYQVDPQPGHHQEGKWSLLLKTGKWVKKGRRYSIYMPRNFTRLTRKPWTVDAINWGTWTFSVK